MNPQVYEKDLTPTSSFYSMLSPFASDFEVILKKTYGRFKTTYPLQVSKLDWAALFLRSFLSRGTETFARSSQTQILFPLGTFMPFFHQDYTRSWVVIPKVVREEGNERTTSDVYDLVELVEALVQKYLGEWQKNPDYDELVKQIQQDDDIAKMLDLLSFYVATLRDRPQAMRLLKFESFYHPLICFLLVTIRRGGIPALMNRLTQLKDQHADFLFVYDAQDIVQRPHPEENLDFSSRGAYSSYNWELFFHIPFQVATRLSQEKRFEDAQTWFNYIFNPSAAQPGNIPNKYWHTKPFHTRDTSEYLSQRIDQILYRIGEHPDGAFIDELKFAVSEWRSKPFSPHVIARSRTVSYQVALVLRYIKNFIEWGDSLFQQFTRESVVLATQMYVLADKLLGPKPRQVEPAVPTPIRTYNQLQKHIDLFGNALVEIENFIPVGDIIDDGSPSAPSPLTFSSLYFAIPQDEDMLKNIDGVPAPLSLFAPPIDPGALVRAFASGADIGAVLQGLSAPLPNYRFWFMVQKAQELAGITAGLGNALLAALEKRDAEGLARLRADHEIVVLNAIRTVKKTAIEEAEGSVDSLSLSKKVANERKTYYEGKEYMNAWETAGTVIEGTSLALAIGANLAYIFSGAAKIAPTFTAGVAGFGGSPVFLASYGGETIGGAGEMVGKSLATISGTLDKAAAMVYRQGSFKDREDDWKFNARLATKEIDVIDKQIENAQLHVRYLKEDLDAHDASTRAAQETGNYMRSKYTNKELYDWMVSQISSIYFGAYKLAYDAAKMAERTYMHELADTSGRTFIAFKYWDSLKSGLLSAETLLQDIKRMELAFVQANEREYELSKNLSLAELDPHALYQLRTTGKCTVHIPEESFDMDHPGHYLRRNKAVAISIPCVAGPQVSVSAKLSLISNRYRATTTFSQGGTTNLEKYREDPDGDTRFVYNVGSIQSIATSTAANDAGIFELSFRDERYLPFEHTGAVGIYQLELPSVITRFDYGTITDVIFHILYTARDGGGALREAVEGAQLEMLNTMTLAAQHHGLYQGYSLRQQFGTEWSQLLTSLARKTAITIDARHLPFFARRYSPAIEEVEWFAQLDGNPSQFVLKLDGVDLTLRNSPPLPAGIMHGKSATDAIVLGRAFTIAVADAAAVKLEDLTFLVKYKIAR